MSENIKRKMHTNSLNLHILEKKMVLFVYFWQKSICTRDPCAQKSLCAKIPVRKKSLCAKIPVRKNPCAQKSPPDRNRSGGDVLFFKKV